METTAEMEAVVRVRNVFWLDERFVRDILQGCNWTEYAKPGFKYQDWWWLEPGAVILIETDARTGPFDPEPVQGCELAPAVINGLVLGVVTDPNGAFIRQQQVLGYKRARQKDLARKQCA